MTRAPEEQLVEEDSARETTLAPNTADPSEVLHAAAECTGRGAYAVMATVLARHGSTPATPGQKLLVASDGTCVGTVGGGALERAVLAALVVRLATRTEPGAERASYRLGASLGMCCGGTVEVLLETLASARAVLVVGAGHVGQACAPRRARGVDRACDRDADRAAPALPRRAVGRGGSRAAARRRGDRDDPRSSARSGGHRLGPP
jgi:xanthine dehydrogenase accessory factor